jgi:leader peptidase (prepilin peptidase) / N-methyltransferase
VELATAALFLLSFLHFRLSLAGIGMDALCFLLLGLAVMDAETLRLPDAFTLPGIALGILYGGLLPAATVGTHLLDAVLAVLWATLAALMILVIRWAYYLVRHEEGMGIGDAKLLAMIAAWLGPWLTLVTVVIGVVVAAILGILMIAVGPRRGEGGKVRLPFGAFLCAAAIYAIFAGRPIVHWYLRFFRQ